MIQKKKKKKKNKKKKKKNSTHTFSIALSEICIYIKFTNIYIHTQSHNVTMPISITYLIHYNNTKQRTEHKSQHRKLTLENNNNNKKQFSSRSCCLAAGTRTRDLSTTSPAL